MSLAAGVSRRAGRNSNSATNYKGNDTKVNQDGGTTDEYAALDQFGRVINPLGQNGHSQTRFVLRLSPVGVGN